MINNMNELPSSYDAWKTACCDRWPNCSHCPYEEDEDEDEEEDYEDKDETEDVEDNGQ